MANTLPPDPLTLDENLIYRCRLLSVWRDGPFLTFVIPTQHSRATLSREESEALIRVLLRTPPRRPLGNKTGRHNHRKGGV